MTKLKLTLALMGAFASGAGLGVLLTKNYFEKKYKEEALEAIQDARVALIKRAHKSTSEDVNEDQNASERDLKRVLGIQSPSDEFAIDKKEIDDAVEPIFARQEGFDESGMPIELKPREGFDEFGRQKDAPDFDPTGYSKYHAVSPDLNKPSLEELARLREIGPDDDGSEFGYDKEDPNFMEDFTQSENDAFEEDAPRLDGGERDPDPSGRAPYIISEHEYVYGDRSFSKVCMTYYEKDKVLCDDDGSPVNVDNFVGRKAINKLREEDAVYVRNERLGIDVEIVAIDEWFNEPGKGDEEDD